MIESGKDLVVKIKDEKAKPKKRGRKPKKKPEEESGVVKKPKKRGRKPKEVTKNNNLPNGLDSSGVKDSIIHLKTNSGNINENLTINNLLKYDPDIVNNIPLPYDPSLNNEEFKIIGNIDNEIKSEKKDINFENNINNIQIGESQLFNNENLVSNINSNINKYNENKYNENKYNENKYNENKYNENKYNETNEISILNSSVQKKNISPIMIYFNEYNKRKEWPRISNIKCLWCCHNFEDVPCAIPYSLENDKFFVFGNFCSPECAASYNFDSKENDKEIWDRYSLLNYLYSIIYDIPDLTIKLAAPRLALKIFGGKLTIEQFRECNINNYKSYKIVFPPMVSIIASLEEEKKDTIIKKNNYQPIDKNSVKKKNNDLRLKRVKPVSNKNTLENCMRLKYI